MNYLELAKELKGKSVEEIALQLEKIDGGQNSDLSSDKIIRLRRGMFDFALDMLGTIIPTQMYRHGKMNITVYDNLVCIHFYHNRREITEKDIKQISQSLKDIWMSLGTK